MQGISSNILDIRFYDAEVQRVLLSATHGLRNTVNNKGIIVGSSVRFPITDIDGISNRVSKGSPINPDDLMADVKNIDIESFEASCKVFPQDLAATNSEAGIRANAALKVVHAMENRFTQCILDAFKQYDDTEMEIGSSSTKFTTASMDELNLLADNHGWGAENKFVLLPAEAKYSLMQDDKFYEIWSLKNGRSFGDSVKSSDNNMNIEWTPYRGFNVGFMPKAGRNVVGLPTASDTSLMGYAWKSSRVGFAMNQNMTSKVFEDATKEGNPIVFKTNGSCGAGIIDKEGVIGIKIDPTV